MENSKRSVKLAHQLFKDLHELCMIYIVTRMSSNRFSLDALSRDYNRNTLLYPPIMAEPERRLADLNAHIKVILKTRLEDQPHFFLVQCHVEFLQEGHPQ